MDAQCINLQMFSIEVALFDSLGLLGFDENKFQIQLIPGLFSRANYAAGDALFYFIFSKLRPTQYEADFQGLWPNSGKSVAAAFRKVIAFRFFAASSPTTRRLTCTVKNCGA